jgi:hypothetical protein
MRSSLNRGGLTGSLFLLPRELMNTRHCACNASTPKFMADWFFLVMSLTVDDNGLCFVYVSVTFLVSNSFCFVRSTFATMDRGKTSVPHGPRDSLSISLSHLTVECCNCCTAPLLRRKTDAGEVQRTRAPNCAIAHILRKTKPHHQLWWVGDNRCRYHSKHRSEMKHYKT